MSAEAYCKACTKPMVEGRAYELGGHRWHVECFRCSVCSDLLTAHTNMLVLGDGTLVCAKCSYTCSVCSKKITDMAVLTNDQAFCASCFVCRNCKNRIDDLKYARTSQGIFCMNCHNALLARKRQRQLAAGQGSSQSGSTSASSAKSSKSSLVSSSSFNRTKELPELPLEQQSTYDSATDATITGGTPSSTGASTVASTNSPSASLAGINGGAAYGSERTSSPAAASAAASASTGSASLKAENSAGAGTSSSGFPASTNASGSSSTTVDGKRELRVPRKQLAPSAFDALEQPTTPRRTANAYAGTPSRMRNSETPTPEAARTLHGHVRTPDRSRADDVLSVPQRSQLRPLSPGRRGPPTPSLPHSPAPPVPNQPPSWPEIGVTAPYVTNLASPQASLPPSLPGSTPSSVAPSQPGSAVPGSAGSNTSAPAPPRSPFAKLWHRRDASTSSTASTGSAYIPISAPVSLGAGHRRSLSDNGGSPGSTPGMSTPYAAAASISRDGLAEALAAVAAETRRANAAEARLSAVLREQAEKARTSENEPLRELNGRRSAVAQEVLELERAAQKLREEHRVLSSKNHQLREMNAELERQTLEKFGPNSLWGSQNPEPALPPPPPTTSGGSMSAPQSASQSYGFGSSSSGKDAPLVTRLDGGGSAAPSMPLQNQFSQLRSAKQWLFRRPIKSSTTSNGPSQAVVTQVGSQVTPTLVHHHAGASTNRSSPSSESDGVSAPPGASRSMIGESLAYRAHVDEAPVPYFVTQCLAEVERRGLDTEGVYRIPGSKSQVDALLSRFGEGNTASAEELLHTADIQAVTSAVKQYLRYLSDPVISYDSYDAFIAAGNARSPHVLRRAVQALPPEHLATLRAVANHLALVASHEEANLMGVRNLATVFAPTLARDETGEREIPDMQARNEAMQMLITNAHSLVEPIDELL